MRGADRRERRSVLRLALLAAVVLVPVGESAAERLPVKAYTTDNGLAITVSSGSCRTPAALSGFAQPMD
jgi:hypothetical protein